MCAGPAIIVCLGRAVFITSVIVCIEELKARLRAIHICYCQCIAGEATVLLKLKFAGVFKAPLKQAF